MLVYGPSAGGALRALANQLRARTLNDLSKPVDSSWVQFALHTLDAAAAAGEVVVFDLTFVEGIDDVLAGVGEHAQTVTAAELRHIRHNWGRFAVNVQFYESGSRRSQPWLQH